MGTEHDDDPWIAWSRITLLFTGVAYLGLGVAMGFLFPTLMAIEEPGRKPPPREVAIAFGVFFFVFSAGIAAVNLLAAWGLGRRHKWAWFVTVILGAMYAPSACLPFGVVLLYGMLNERTRKSFLG